MDPSSPEFGATMEIEGIQLVYIQLGDLDSKLQGLFGWTNLAGIGNMRIAIFVDKDEKWGVYQLGSDGKVEHSSTHQGYFEDLFPNAARMVVKAPVPSSK